LLELRLKKTLFFRRAVLGAHQIKNRIGIFVTALLLCACGGGNQSSTPSSYTLAGTIIGLPIGQQVVLSNKGAATVTVAQNGTFSFGAGIPNNGTYAVTVATQPTGAVCTVSNGSGSGMVANVNNLAVTCSTDTYTIGGTTTGMAAGQQLVLQNNGADALTVTANSTFSFPLPVAYNSSYAITVAAQPLGQTCTVSNGSGAGVVTNINNVAVTCSADTYTVGGAMSGLAAGQQVVLQNNGADAFTVTANAAFTFPTPVAYNGGYAVTVGTQPVGQTCSVSNGSGAGMVANINNLAVTCSANSYTVGGTVTGLASGQQFVLQNNGTNALILSANGTFVFSTPIAYNGSYAVTVGTQPTGQTCTVSNGAGSGMVANVNNLVATCSTNTYTVSGTVTGLASGLQLVLLDNGTNALTLASNSAFTFSIPVAFNGSYSVTLGTQPLGQTCTVSNGSGAGMVANINNVAVTCSTNTFIISGSLHGLAAGQQVVVNDNGADPLTLISNVTFSFATAVAYNGSYRVTVGTQPTGQTCSVSSGSGNLVTANVTAVVVICSTNSYAIRGTVSGLSSGEQVTLLNNNDNPQTVTSNTSYSFSTPVAYGGSYSVTIGTQPLTQSCTVSNASGSSVTSAPTVNISCAAATETTLYSFGGTSGDAATFFGSGLTLGADGNFYGASSDGGANGKGAVFKITPSGTETVLYSFTGGSDGKTPRGKLVQWTDGNFYGVTINGGANGQGAIYKITPAGSITVIYSFNSGTGDGQNPYGGLTLGNDGNFYGTTGNGGASNQGTVFKVTPAGSESVIYSFAGGSDGGDPSAALALGSDGNFYGTTEFNGANGSGTFFQITPAGVETVLHQFGASGDVGAVYDGVPTQASDGNFYGQTGSGGANGNGGVYKISPTGVESVIYSFSSTGSDANAAIGTLIQGTDGNLYGTSFMGGTNNAGTIYKVTMAGAETVLYSFAGSSTDGASPSTGGLTLGTDGYLYGLAGLISAFGTNGGTYNQGTFFRY
jgi:uncharacterized repeat protein (TIGR03803 family)